MLQDRALAFPMTTDLRSFLFSRQAVRNERQGVEKEVAMKNPPSPFSRFVKSRKGDRPPLFVALIRAIRDETEYWGRMRKATLV